MKLSVGIAGLPNVGKSTLFNALRATQKKLAEVSNYPFTTIEPNVGIVPVPDGRLEKLAKLVKPTQKISAVVEFFDIAGLVKNAHQGEGLGNQFLAKIREVTIIVQVVRVFENENIAHVEGEINPLEDIKTIQTELALSDLETLKRHLKKLEEESLGKKKEDKIFEKITVYRQVEQQLSHGIYKGPSLVNLDLLSAKPQIIVLNISEQQLKELTKGEGNIQRLQKEIEKAFLNTLVIPICAKLEADLISLSQNERVEYCQSIGLKVVGFERLILAAYQLLDLVTFYTTQNQILRAWSIQKESTALKAASLIHTDFAAGFIKAEVIAYEQFLKASSWEAAREKGWVRLEGKDYLVQDGDVVYFKVRT